MPQNYSVKSQKRLNMLIIDWLTRINRLLAIYPSEPFSFIYRKRALGMMVPKTLVSRKLNVGSRFGERQ